MSTSERGLTSVPSLLVITALWKRRRIAEIMLDHLKAQRTRLKGQLKLGVLAVGSEGSKSRRLVESRDLHYIEHRNKPLGEKWNAALHEAQWLDPDAVIILGSDNFANDAMLLQWAAYIRDGYEYVGVLDAFRYGVPTDQLVHWHGYENFRRGEPIGPSRCFAKTLLDRIDWHLWDSKLDSSLDYSATERLASFVPKKRFVRMNDGPIKHLGLAVEGNICPFWIMVETQEAKIEIVPSQQISEWFGEIGERILELHKDRAAHVVQDDAEAAALTSAARFAPVQSLPPPLPVGIAPRRVWPTGRFRDTAPPEIHVGDRVRFQRGSITVEARVIEDLGGSRRVLRLQTDTCEYELPADVLLRV